MMKYTYVSTRVFQKRLMCGTMTRLGKVTVNLDRTFQQTGILDEIRKRQYVCICKPLSEGRLYRGCHCLWASDSSFSGLSIWTHIRSCQGTSKSVVSGLGQSSFPDLPTTTSAHRWPLFDYPAQSSKWPCVI